MGGAVKFLRNRCETLFLDFYVNVSIVGDDNNLKSHGETHCSLSTE
jgi:hypothetical protein